MRSPPTARIRRATGRIIPQKTARIIRMESLRTPHPPLFTVVRVQRGQLIPVALLSSDLWARFYAPIQLRLGPMTAFAGIFVQPHPDPDDPTMIAHNRAIDAAGSTLRQVNDRLSRVEERL